MERGGRASIPSCTRSRRLSCWRDYEGAPERGVNHRFSSRSGRCAIKNRAPLRILIVEDEPALAQHLARALADAGYATDGASDGDRADFLVRTSAWDAIVLDLGLPRIDGLTLLRGWRESGI